MTRDFDLATIAARAGVETDSQHGGVIPPLFLSSTFTFEDYGKPRKYDYTRSGNPTRDQLGTTLAQLEGGVDAVITPSGMAAVNLCLQLLKPGDLLIAPHDCYGGTFRLFDNLSRKGHFRVLFVDQTDAVKLAGALAQKPAMLWIESPSNPLLRITDIRKAAGAAKAAGATVVVDNTFLSPILQQPLTLGADVVVHSTTKYINGHSDVVGGAVIAGNDQLAEQLAWWANCTGITGSPFDSYLTLRGLRTLKTRMRQHCRNAQRVAEFLSAHPRVAKVYYPGLPGHPSHGIAARQQRGFGGMLSFELEGGEGDVATFVRNLECFSLAESLGGVESLVAHPASMTHASMHAEARRRAGISDGLIRISCGIEDSTDLIEDLQAALNARPVATTCFSPLAQAV